jgi:DNA mismatch endonuclease, patch repair protein
MADTFTKEVRSNIMRAVKSKGNKSTEGKLIKLFKEKKLTGWRRNYPIFGKPDFVFPKNKVAVFADGCFWHGHNCRNISPKSNAEYWMAKIAKNKNRDKEVNKVLKEKGWSIFRIFECKIKRSFLPQKLVAKTLK